MDQSRKRARDHINDSTLEEFKELVAKARISDEDQEILDLRFINGWTIAHIAQEKYISEEKVKATIKKAYNRIAKLLSYI